MYTFRVLQWTIVGFILVSSNACMKSGNGPGSSSNTNLNSVEAQIAGTWKLVSKIDTSVLAGNIISANSYSNFTYYSVVEFGTLVDNASLNPVAKSYSYKGLNMGPVFEGPPDSTLSGRGTWYYDLANKSIYLNFGRYGFSMTNASLTISATGDGSPTLTNTWIFTR